MMCVRRTFLVLFLMVVAPPFRLLATEPGEPQILTRLIWQDDDAKSLRAANLLQEEIPKLGPVLQVSDFPRLDKHRQTLVQMDVATGMLLVGVRDDDNGNFQSGWVLVDSGVEEEEHGNHSHWHYLKLPTVRASVLDGKQGNPAHLYCYDQTFFLANDKLNGFTWINPRAISAADSAGSICQKAAFHQGGGGHITLAVVEGKMAFSAWIDRDGSNKGRIDRTALSPLGNLKIDETFYLPHGGVHGAIANQGKVFFAPSDGIYWIDANRSEKPPIVHHISLGMEGGRPRRTGAFSAFGKHVAFVTGSGATAKLCFLNASSEVPSVHERSLNIASGGRPTGLEFVKPRQGPPLAFVFHDFADGTEGQCRLTITSVDPNEDGDWTDATVVHSTDVGKAKVEGHGGHHCVAFDADRRYAIFTNPGDGSIAVMSLRDFKILSQFSVGGIPSKLVAIGGRSGGD